MTIHKETRNDRHTSSISSLLNDKQSNYLPTPATPEEEETTHRPFVCNQCNQLFSRAHNLKSHLATHSAERPFQCNTCHHYFRRQHDLKRHQKLHTGERPHVCKNCGRSFARLDALNRHQRAESNTNPPQQMNNKSITTAEAVASSVTRPVIPQLDIPNPASKPHKFSPIPQQQTTSPKSLSLSLPPLRSPSFSMDGYDKSPIHSTTSSPPPYRSWSYPNTNSLSSPPSPMLNRLTLPLLPSPDLLLLPLQQQVRCLEQENTLLKQEIKNMSIDHARVHDLEVENKLLKSLIQQNTTEESVKNE